MDLEKEQKQEKKEQKQEKQEQPKIHPITDTIKSNINEILGEEKLENNLGKDVLQQIQEKIENNQMRYVAQGDEGIIYKIEIELESGKKTFFAEKKRFDNTIKKEMTMQQSFLEVEHNSGVKVPKKFEDIKIKNENYILMEYIEGKTLFNLKMEKLASSLYEKYQEEYSNFFKNLKGLNKNKDEKNINQRNIFSFENDTEARSIIFNIIEFLKDNFKETDITSKYQRIKNRILTDKRTYNKEIDNLYDEKIHGKIFTQEEGKKLQQQIQEFFFECHKKGLFHREIGEDTSNIMMVQKNGNIIPVVIDFGKAIEYSGDNTQLEYKRGEGPYQDEKGIYVPDTNICKVIQTVTEDAA